MIPTSFDLSVFITQAAVALLNTFWITVVLGAAAWLAFRFLPRIFPGFNAATRYGLAWALALSAIAVPLATPWIPQLQWSIAGTEVLATDPVETMLEEPQADISAALLEPEPRAIASTTALPEEQATLTPSFETAEETAQPVQALPPSLAVRDYTLPAAGQAYPAITLSPGSWVWAALAIWASFAAYRLYRISASYLYLRKIKLNATRIQGPLRANFEEWCLACRIQRPARLLQSTAIARPIAVGFIRPAVVLPQGLLDQLGQPEQDHILLHELAHLDRYDDWANLAARFLEAFLGLHPVAAWAFQQIRKEREQACDDWVINTTGDARPYAESLTRLFELTATASEPGRQQLASAMAERGSHLGERIERILRKTSPGSPRLSRPAFAAGVALLGLGIFAGAQSGGWVAYAAVEPQTFDALAFFQDVELEHDAVGSRIVIDQSDGIDPTESALAQAGTELQTAPQTSLQNPTPSQPTPAPQAGLEQVQSAQVGAQDQSKYRYELYRQEFLRRLEDYSEQADALFHEQSALVDRLEEAYGEGNTSGMSLQELEEIAGAKDQMRASLETILLDLLEMRTIREEDFPEAASQVSEAVKPVLQAEATRRMEFGARYLRQANPSAIRQWVRLGRETPILKSLEEMRDGLRQVVEMLGGDTPAASLERNSILAQTRPVPPVPPAPPSPPAPPVPPARPATPARPAPPRPLSPPTPPSPPAPPAVPAPYGTSLNSPLEAAGTDMQEFNQRLRRAQVSVSIARANLRAARFQNNQVEQRLQDLADATRQAVEDATWADSIMDDIQSSILRESMQRSGRAFATNPYDTDFAEVFEQQSQSMGMYLLLHNSFQSQMDRARAELESALKELSESGLNQVDLAELNERVSQLPLNFSGVQEQLAAAQASRQAALDQARNVRTEQIQQAQQELSRQQAAENLAQTQQLKVEQLERQIQALEAELERLSNQIEQRP